MSVVKKYEGGDLALWCRFLKGDKNAFATIFDTHLDMLYRYGNAITGHNEIVQDSIQDIFIELWQNREKLKETDSIRFYLFKILRRKIYRNLDLRVDLKEDIAAFNLENELPFEAIIIEHEDNNKRLAYIANAIQILPPRQREVIELRFYQGFSYEQIAEITDINLQSVHNNMHRALTTLRQRLPNELFLLWLMLPSLSI
jgi:RNA polymerase sigma-70 factor (ECF subfamily)